MAERYGGVGGVGSQGERPYSGSGPSGNSDTEAGLARLAALGDIDESDLPSRQGESGTPQDDRASAAAELRERLKGIANSTKPSELTRPQNRDQILASLHDETGTQEAPAPQTAEEIWADQHREALWSAEGTLRNTPEMLVAAANELESIIADGNVPASVVPRLGSIVERLRDINLHDFDVARQQVGTTAYAMDMEKNNRQ